MKVFWLSFAPQLLKLFMSVEERACNLLIALYEFKSCVRKEKSESYFKPLIFVILKQLKKN
jgi:hypothetical protein